MEDDEHGPSANGGNKTGAPVRSNGAGIKQERSGSPSPPNDSRLNSRSSSVSPVEVKVKSRSASASTPDSGPAPKLSRKASQKIQNRPAVLYDHLPNVTEESCSHFQVINDCLYGSKHMGSSEHDALDCDCAEEWHDGRNNACGEDSDCINRATKMECVDGDCNCGRGCQNQRFQRKQYANVSVIKTEKKGFGLRTDSDLQTNDFIFEYIGEVINEPTFRRRMRQYDDEGIRHFYFMSLTKHEFVDATKKGNLGRFCNHSCNPNCYVDKWVVGDKLRMGIFAGRRIQAGEELVFNYNVDRYGADPQPCYCGEINCTGFIGGKTQTERATKLAPATIEALGIDDGDDWDTAVAKKPRKKKVNEDDEEYVNSVQPRGLHEDGVTKVMAALMQCKEKWIAVKLLARIQEADDERVFHRVVRMHGYQILKTTLNTFSDDDNVVLQILDILDRFPRLTKNKISDSKIEQAIEALGSSAHEDVVADSKRLLAEWSKLEVAYRIPRKKFDPSAQAANSFEERRPGGVVREEEAVTRPAEPVTSLAIPTGPRSTVPQRNAGYFNGPRPRRPPGGFGLPPGWFQTTDLRGNIYFYTNSGVTTWQRPTLPADKTAKGPSKAQQAQEAVQGIIDSLTRETPRLSASHTPQGANTPVQEAKKEKWRSYPKEKQMKIYENTLFPHVKAVTDKYRHKLPKEEIKKFAKEINKKFVASDYKNNRVSDPNRISTKQEKKIRAYVKSFFDRAVEKYQEHEKRKKQRAAKQLANGAKDISTKPDAESTPAKDDADVDGMDIAVLSDDDAASVTSSDRKRKRDAEDEAEPDSASATPSEAPSGKRLKEDEGDAPSPPPPPPPPPEDDAMDLELTEEELVRREQEAALVRENEEAQRWEREAERHKMREEEEALERENEEAMLDFQRAQNGDVVGEGKGVEAVNGTGDALNGTLKMDLDGGEPDRAADAGSVSCETEARKQKAVMGH